MFDKGKDPHTRAHQEARYKMRAGMAVVALRHKRGEKPAVDAHGKPMAAMEMAERHGTKTLEAWSRGSRKVVVTL